MIIVIAVMFAFKLYLDCHKEQARRNSDKYFRQKAEVVGQKWQTLNSNHRQSDSSSRYISTRSIGVSQIPSHRMAMMRNLAGQTDLENLQINRIDRNNSINIERPALHKP